MRQFFLAVVVAASVARAADPEAPERWRVEVSLAPLSSQLNGVWVQHHGSGLQVSVVVASRFRLLASVTHHWSAGPSSLNLQADDNNTRIESEPFPRRMYLPQVALLGTELVLARGVAAPLASSHRFELTFQGLLGAASSTIELKPVSLRADGSSSPATSGDAGLRPTAGVGLGLRFEFLERFSLRVDVRSLVFSERVTRVNGCDVQDLRSIDMSFRGLSSRSVGPECRVDQFEGINPNTGASRVNDAPLALAHTRVSSPGLGALVSAQVALGVTF